MSYKPDYYPREDLLNELHNVFKSVWFDDIKQERRIHASYCMNFANLLRYADENGIDKLEYIRSIRHFLLTIPGVRSKENEHQN